MANREYPLSCTCGQCRRCKKREADRRWRANLSPERRAEMLERAREYKAEWYRRLTPEQRREKEARRDPERVRQRDRERYKRHKAKYLARNKARDAKKKYATATINARLQRGTIVKPDACSDCGATGVKLTGHHEDYDKPLEVEWLCYSCHGKRHRTPDEDLVGI